MQREASAKRKAIREDVTTEVMAEPVNQVRQWIKGGQTDGEHLSLADLKKLYPQPSEADGRGFDDLVPTGDPSAYLDDVKAIKSGMEKAALKEAGPSLSEMLAAAGGVIDDGGDIKAFDGHKQVLNKGVGKLKKLVNPEGMTLEVAAERAHDEGYFREVPSRNELVNALRDEASGKRVQSDNYPHYIDRLNELDSLSNRIDGLGLPENATAKEIAAALAKDDAFDDHIRQWASGELPDVAPTEIDGVPADAIAEQFGYTSGQAMVHDLITAPKAKDAIAYQTDQRMLAENGDLVNPKALARAADEAIHNDARIRFMAAGLVALDKSLGDRNVLAASTKALAAEAMGRKTLRDMKPAVYTAAEAKAGRAVMKALKAGDTALAAAEMRKQLFNAQMAKAAMAAQDEVRKGEAFFERIVGGKDANTAKRRNMDIVNAARGVLDAYGYDRAANDPKSYMELVKEYDPILHDDLTPWIDAAMADAPRSRDPKDLTLTQFRTLKDTAAQLYEMALRSQQMRREGQLVDLDKVAKETAADLPEVTGGSVGMASAPTKLDEIKSGLLGVVALLRRVEDWAKLKGKNFERNIWAPLSDASLQFRQLSAKYRGELLENLKPIADDLKVNKKIEAPEIGYTFGAGTNGYGLAELIGALRHTGNTSNLEKLLIGRGWAEYAPDGSVDTTRWQALLDRVHADGTLQKRHWDYVQSEWNLHEAIKPLVQDAHRSVYGRYFEEVKASPVETPFGSYAGGYVPAITDPRIVEESLMRQDADALLGGNGGTFMFPSVANGFTKGRNANYAKALLIDMSLAGHQIDAALKFATLAEPVRDALRLIKNAELSRKLKAADPVAATDLLLPWLKRTASQATSVPTSGKAGRAIDGASSFIRQRAVMAMMFGNLSNTLANITGLAPAALRTGKRNMLGAVWQFIRSPRDTAKQVAEASPFMADRMTNQMREMADAIHDIVKPKNPLETAQNWSVKHTYFMQHGLQNMVDQVVWTAAYNHANETGEANPVTYADGVVRTTQGSSNAVDVSKFESGPAWAKLFTTFSGYFLSQGNLIGTEFAKAAARKSPAGVFNVYMLGVMVPAFGAELISTALRGGYDDKDGDGSLIDDLLKAFFGSQASYIAGGIPVIGPVINAGINRALGRQTDSSISVSPVVSVAEGAIGTPFDVWELTQGKGNAQRTVRDTASLATLATGIPLTLLGRPAGYAAGVAQGKIEPTGPADAARGLVTGAASPQSRQ